MVVPLSYLDDEDRSPLINFSTDFLDFLRFLPEDDDEDEDAAAAAAAAEFLGDRFSGRKRASWKSSQLKLLSWTCSTELSRAAEEAVKAASPPAASEAAATAVDAAVSTAVEEVASSVVATAAVASLAESEGGGKVNFCACLAELEAVVEPGKAVAGVF